MADITLDEAKTKQNLIDLAKSEVKELLIDEADIEKDILELDFLIAAVAYKKLSLIEGGAEASSVKVGEVSVSRKSGEKYSADELLAEFKQGARGYLKDCDFYFGGVC